MMVSTEQTLEDLTLTINQGNSRPGASRGSFCRPAGATGSRQRNHGRQTSQHEDRSVARRQWYRDLGGDNGHFWAHVQAIKRPTLLEFAGPLFASFPFVSTCNTAGAKSTGEP